MKSWLHDNFLKVKQALFKTNKIVEEDKTAESDFLLEINDTFYENLLEKMIKADIGLDLSEEIITKLKEQIRSKGIKANEFKTILKNVIKDVVVPVLYKDLHADTEKINLYLIVGVNGSGKTTSIAKLAYNFKNQDFKILIVAADTFRAAAQDQLSVWAKKVQVELFAPSDIKRPDAVVFSAIEKARKENYNLLLIDTAGRLHSQTNLMDELKKINLIVEKNSSGFLVEKFIVLDATIGQNAISQAEIFSKTINLSGIILAKLDSSAKGGVILNIMNKLNLPVRFVGTGEKPEDLVEFNIDEYLDGLLN